jgi:hypothetical protein
MNEVSILRNGVPVLPASVSGKSCWQVLLASLAEMQRVL